MRDRAGNPYLLGWLSAVDFLVLTILDRLLLILKTLFTIYKANYLMRRSTVLSLPVK